MRLSTLAVTFALAIFFLTVTSAHAQYRDKVNSGDFSGPLVGQQNYEPGNWSNLFNMRMAHSYSMVFSSAGGKVSNINAYTNTMNFYFTDNLTGQVDISLLHSPFGNSYLNSGNNSAGAEIIIRNAELNYQFNENSSITLQFRQQPVSYFGRSPFDRFGFESY